MFKFIFLMICFFLTSVSAQTLSNIDFFAEGKKVIITYDLANCEPGEFYDVTLNFVEQNTLKVSVPKTISGDIKKITCGSKRIVWDIGADVSMLSGRFYPELEVMKAKKSLFIEKNSVKIEFVEIPAGTYKMGSNKKEIGRSYDEQQHKVTLPSFKMSKNEITFEQFDVFCEATGRIKPNDSGWGRGNRPVINVSWDDAKAFADWMGLHLPSDKQWEYACRSGTQTPFSTGDNLTTQQANYNGNETYNNNPKGEFVNKTQPVGSYPSNTWGLNDMHGNVYEWCVNYHYNYENGDIYFLYLKPLRVLRGGSWLQGPNSCRSAFRGYHDPKERNNFIGFRLVAP